MKIETLNQYLITYMWRCRFKAKYRYLLNNPNPKDLIFHQAKLGCLKSIIDGLTDELDQANVFRVTKLGDTTINEKKTFGN